MWVMTLFKMSVNSKKLKYHISSQQFQLSATPPL